MDATETTIAAAAALLIGTAPVQAATDETHFCQQSPFNEAMCVVSAIGAVGIIAILASRDKDRASGDGSSGRIGSSPNYGTSGGGSDAGTPYVDDDPDDHWDHSADGCTWGSRKYGTCR